MPKRKKAQLYDIITRIVFLYEREGKNFREIESILRSEGYYISKSAIHRAYRSYAKTAEEFKKIYEETKALIETLKNNPATDVMESIAVILANRLFKFVRDIQAIEFETPEELISSVQKLAKTLNDLQKVREERDKKILQILEKGAEDGKVKEDILNKIRELYGA